MWLAILATICVIILVISLFWTISRGAPWAPTPMHLVYKMLKMAEVEPDDVVFDLGCGDGRMIVTAARHYGARAVGIEIDPLRYLWCQVVITILGLRSRVRIVYGDFFTQDLRAADVVTCYLLRSTNKKLQMKFKDELRPDTRVVSNYFTFPALNMIGQDEEEKLYLYNLECE